MLLPEVGDERIIVNLSTVQLVRLVRRLLGPLAVVDAEALRQNIERLKTELKGN